MAEKINPEEFGTEILGNVLSYASQNPKEARLLVYLLDCPEEFGFDESFYEPNRWEILKLEDQKLIKKVAGEENRYSVTLAGKAVAKGIKKFVNIDELWKGN